MVGLTKTKFENKSNKYKKKAFRKILFDEFFEMAVLGLSSPHRKTHHDNYKHRNAYKR